MESKSKRDGRAIDQVGYYNPISKQVSLEADKIIKWRKIGVRPTKTVLNLLKQTKLLNT